MNNVLREDGDEEDGNNFVDDVQGGVTSIKILPFILDLRQSFFLKTDRKVDYFFSK
jgi:hypothetical protein